MRHTGWQSRESYCRFLQVQLAARLPIEEYFAQFSATCTIPPAQASLILRDLEHMGLTPEAQNLPRFELPKHANRVGAFWAIAGSSLGNKAILREVERSAGGRVWPSAFLSDRSMNDYWKGLRKELDRPASHDMTEDVFAAAKAVFSHFHVTAQRISFEHAG